LSNSPLALPERSDYNMVIIDYEPQSTQMTIFDNTIITDYPIIGQAQPVSIFP